MKKFLISLLALFTIGAFAPVSSALAKNKITVSVKEDSGKYQKTSAKVSKKRKKEREKDTKRRIKKLKELGINKPKSYLSYGDSLTLEEFGKIIGAWIVDAWVKTGALPDKLTNDPPDWLMVNIDGTCHSDSDTCERWEK